MTMYIEFCKVVLNQIVSQLGKKHPISHGNKIFQIIIITNIEILTVR